MKYVFESPPSKIHFAAHARYPHIIAKAKLAHAQQPLPIYLLSIFLKVFFGGWGGSDTPNFAPAAPTLLGSIAISMFLYLVQRAMSARGL